MTADAVAPAVDRQDVLRTALRALVKASLMVGMVKYVPARADGQYHQPRSSLGSRAMTMLMHLRHAFDANSTPTP